MNIPLLAESLGNVADALRACALDSMVDESSDVLESSPTRKKLTFQHFFLYYYFPPDMLGKRQNFFYPIGRIPVINT